MSPWHDIELESSSEKENMITGVIEITKGTNKKLECFKEIRGNPIM
jgi:inorganic pyrophosphatase